MGDLWDTASWKGLRLSFPNDSSGSKILFTYQLLNVALQAKTNCEAHIHLLSNDESW